MAIKKDGKTWKLREDFRQSCVAVYMDNFVAFRSSSYGGSADFIQKHLDLNANEMETIYRDYRKDYDHQCDI